MKNVSMAVFLNDLLMATLLTIMAVLLSSCEASIGESKDQKDAAFTRGIVFKVHCSKMVYIRLTDTLKRVEYTDAASEGASKSKISDKEFIGEMTYRLSEYADGSREIDCQLTDGARQYTGQVSLSAKTAYMSDNLCSIVYDLDSQATNGSFSFYWQTSQRGLTYVDDYGLNKEMYVRSSECSEM